MKNPIRSLFALLAFGAFTLGATAQPAVKILVVDMAKLHDSHYKTQEQMTKLQADKAKAEEQVEQLNKELNVLIEEYKNLQDQSTNAALSADAKAKAANDSQKKLDEIQQKQTEGRNFIQQSGQLLNQRLQSFRSVLLDEITKIATDVAKRKGATILLDKTGLSLIGVQSVLYSDPAYDITDEVMAQINKDKPAGAAAPAAAAPAATPAPSSAAPSSSAPTIGLPGVAPKK